MCVNWECLQANGNIHFDDDELFSLNEGIGTNFLFVAVHEIGHSLGLDHSNIPNSIMLSHYRYK